MGILRAIILLLVLLFTDFEGFQSNPANQRMELRIISESQEVDIGTKHYESLQRQCGGRHGISQEVQEYVRRVGDAVAKVSDRPDLPYEFVVVNEQIPNAWCLPGGKIAIHKGLLLELSCEAELAAVLAHEIAHANLRHGAKKIEKKIFMGSLIDGVDQLTALASLKYDRDFELEADLFSIKYLSASGYDPQSAVELQETFIRLELTHPEWLAFLCSHPTSVERLSANRLTLKKYPSGGERGIVRHQKIINNLKNNNGEFNVN